MQDHLREELQNASLSMFRKNFLGIFHGSVSAKTEKGKFLINTKDAVFDNLGDNDFIELYSNKDYRWREASLDTEIHLGIYNHISEAKYITYSMAPFMTSYAIHHDRIKPKDYFGTQIIGELSIYDPKDFSTWYERAKNEIPKELEKGEKEMLLIRGYGLYSYGRSLNNLIKKIAILENSCKILYRAQQCKY